ncbi:MAG: CRISPR-associated endoribonuclease Cas6 [Calditrichaceae bacterium]
MRIKITFKNKRARTFLPINTNYYLVKLINQLTYEYRRYLNSLLPGIDGVHAKFDMYTFSQLIIPEREIKDFQIGILSSEFYWYISSPYYQFLGLIAKELRDRGKIKIKNAWFDVGGIEFIPSPEFKEAEAQFTCMSPVAVYRQRFNKRHRAMYQFNGGYLLPGEDEYLDYIEKDLIYKYNLIKKQKKNNIRLNLEFDREYIRRKNNRITKVITLENSKDAPEQIRGILAPIHIKAEPEVLQLIYDLGLGQLNDLGFGMLETVNPSRGRKNRTMAPINATIHN